MALPQDRFDLASYCGQFCMSCELIVSSQFRKDRRGQLQCLVKTSKLNAASNFKQASALEGTSIVTCMRRHLTPYTCVLWLVNYITGYLLINTMFVQILS